jgi:hypothetical protein
MKSWVGSSIETSPAGTAENVPGRQSWVNWITCECYGNDPRPTRFPLRPPRFHTIKENRVWVLMIACRYSCAVQVHPGLTSWGILSRPCGTGRGGYVYPGFHPGLLSAVPTGLKLEGPAVLLRDSVWRNLRFFPDYGQSGVPTHEDAAPPENPRPAAY